VLAIFVEENNVTIDCNSSKDLGSFAGGWYLKFGNGVGRSSNLFDDGKSLMPLAFAVIALSTGLLLIGLALNFDIIGHLHQASSSETFDQIFESLFLLF